MDASRVVPGALPLDGSDEDLSLLRRVLENLSTPERLDDHPWTRSRFVVHECESSPSLRRRSPGVQLTVTVARLFRRMMPPAPPRQGKRLDTRWGEFGLLAARYFAPFLFGLPYPASLREAWGGIDAAILRFVGDGRLTPADPQAAPYLLTAGEPGIAPESTLSDWHRKGLLRLAALLQSREHYLEHAPALETGVSSPLRSAQRETFRRFLTITVGLLVVFLLAVAGIKGVRIYRLMGNVRADAGTLGSLAGEGRSLDAFDQAGPPLSALRGDLGLLQREAGPLLGLSPLFGWVPVYGGDLAAASDLLDYASSLAASADEAHRAARPLIGFMRESPALDLPELARLLNEAGPGLQSARAQLDRALAARERLAGARLSPRVRGLPLFDDKLVSMLDDGVSAGLSLPRLLGASAEGPKTYLLLLENEDELRPTGGFITAVGRLVLKDGGVVSLEFENSATLDDWSKAYPPAPWQLQEYMDIPVTLLRDANWSPDFRITAVNAEYLYSLARGHSVDGVLAFDQHALVMLLGAIGPVDLSDAASPVTMQNVIGYMRAAKAPPGGQPVAEGWDRKAFIGKMASAILQKVLSNGRIQLDGLSKTLVQALEERHILVQLDDPAMAGLVSRRGWDGAVVPGEDDFLFVVDANVGYTKTNAVLERRIGYDVDLTDPTAPEAVLTVQEKNNASAGVSCQVMQAQGVSRDEMYYAIDRCYWGYLRVYKPARTTLLEATPHAVAAEQTLNGLEVPARVDTLDEGMDGVQGFGTLVLVPGGQAVETSFRFGLPAGTVSAGAGQGQLAYRLKIKKQPGTGEDPVLVHIQLPPGAQVVSAPAGAAVQGAAVLLETTLNRDLALEVVFTLP